MASGLNFLAGPKEEPRPPVFDEKWRRARAAWRRVREEFGRATGASLHYERVLGMGGYGMAQLWTVRNADGDYVRDIVVKVPMPSPSRSNVADSIRREISWMGKTLRNAEHAVQLVYLTDIAKTDDYRIYNNPYVETPYLIMEALSRGTLMDLITSITQARYWNMANKGAGDQRKVGYVPVRILWRIFLCLTRGITGLAYPPPPGPEEVYRERVPSQQQIQPKALLHMDLDPSNVLIGERKFDETDAEHSISPIVKIADFGLMIDWDDKWTLQERIRLLRRGKISWFTPEQRIPAVIFKRGDVVDYKINVWAIGLVMFNLLTLGHPDDSEGWVPEMTDLDLADFGKPVRVGRVLSWGSLLIRDPRRPLDAGVAEFISSYDGSLRNLIARCMCDDARHRPTLDSLTRMIERGIERADARVRDYVLAGELRQELSPAKPPLFEIDRLLAKFYSDYFYEPHVSEDPYAQYWVDGTPPGAIRIPTAPGRSAPINDLNPMQGVRPGGAPPRNDPGRTQGIRPGGAPPRNDPNRMQGVRQGGAPLRNDPNRMQGIRQGGAPLRNDPNRMQGIRRRGVPDDEFNIWQFPPDEPRFSMQ